MTHVTNEQPQVLLCDAAFSAIPILESLRLKKYDVAVCGNRISDPCHELANSSYPVDYSDRYAVLDLVKEKGVKYIVPGCTDVSYMTSAWIANELGLPGYDNYETVELIHQKDKFRRYCEIKDFPVPKSAKNIEAAKNLQFPLLIKPVDSYSGKGVEKVFDKDELEKHWFNSLNYSASKRVVAEEYIEGDLYSFSAFIKNKKICIDFFVNEYCTVFPYQVNSSNLTSQLPDNIKKSLRGWLESFSEDLELCDGLVHTQFITDYKDFYLIEVARRCPGDLYASLIQRSTGLDYTSLYINSFCNHDKPDDIKPIDRAYVSRYTVSVKKDCFFISSNISLENENIYLVQLKKTGELLKKAPYDRSGIYFIEHETKQKMEELTSKLCDYVNVEKLDMETYR